jgi:hypothetical protein
MQRRRAEGSLMAGHAQGECRERAKRVEGPCTHLVDDGIVVGVWFVYIGRCADDSLYISKAGREQNKEALLAGNSTLLKRL